VSTLLLDLMDSAAGRADYADARLVLSRVERISTRNGGIDELDNIEEEGLGVRVRLGGAWGFAATRGTDRAAAEEALARALTVAESQPAAGARPLAPAEPARGDWRSPSLIDPFDVPLEDKLATLAAADAGMRGDSRVKVTHAHYLAQRVEKTFASTEGALCTQRST